MNSAEAMDASGWGFAGGQLDDADDGPFRFASEVRALIRGQGAAGSCHPSISSPTALSNLTAKQSLRNVEDFLAHLLLLWAAFHNTSNLNARLLSRTFLSP